jgi:sensor domain CHASE-containing protein
MQSETNILFIGIIAMLVVIISVLLWRNLRSQRELREKNDAIIREIQENVKLREELRRRIPHAAVF